MANAPEDALTQQPLLPTHVAAFLDFFNATNALSLREIEDRMLQAAQTLPGVSSALLLLLDEKEQQVRFAWQGLDGELAEGDTLPFVESPWRFALSHGQLWLEADQATAPLEHLPSLETPFVDRCLLPIQCNGKPRNLLILHSTHADLFVSWDRSLLQLLLQSLSQSLNQHEQIRLVSGELAQYKQQNSLYPPSLEGIMQTSRSVLARTNPIATYVQHNLDTLQNYLRRLQNALDYFFDEIRLNAPQESVERVQKFIEYQKLSELRGDLESLVEDSSEGIFQLRYFLNHIRELHYPTSLSEQLSFDEILDPVFPLLFSDKAYQIQRPILDGLPLYGYRTRLQQAFVMLFFTLKKYASTTAEPPHIRIDAERIEDMLYFRVDYALRTEVPSEDDEEYLFLKRIMEEHQGTFNAYTEGKRHYITLGFPLMFAEEQSDDQRYGMEPLELPALDLPALDLSAVSDETPAESSLPPWAQPVQPKHKILLLGTEQKFLRALKRALAHSFEVFLASSTQTALDLTQAHADLGLVLCDLQEGADESFNFLDEMENHSPHLVPYICFLLGERLSPQAETLAQRLAMRTCNRHAPVEEIEHFLNKRTRNIG